MILRRLAIDRFAGLGGLELCFAAGLNVLCGPNEAGKSTVLAALEALLDVRVHKKKEREIFEARAFPVGGGDTIRAALEFSTNGEEYRLSRTWQRGVGTASLELQGGAGLWADPETGLAQLAGLLPARPGTVRQVLLTGQAALARTLEVFAEQETRQTLQDLRQGAAAAEMGAKVFLDVLEKEIALCFGHWDRDAGYPEGRRGIDNPWKKEVGRITAAFYQQEHARRAYTEALALEQDRDAAAERLAQHGARGEALHDWLAAHRRAYDDAGERSRLEGQLEALELRFRQAQEANRLWPISEADRGRFAGELETARQDHAALLRQAEQAAAWERAALDRKVLEEARQREADRAAAAAALAALPQVDAAALQELERIGQRLPVVESGLAGARLAAEFEAKAALDFVLELPDGQERVTLAAGGVRRTVADGRIGIEHAGLSIRIVSGTAEATALLEEAATLRARQAVLEAALLETTGAGELAAVREIHAARQAAERALAAATAEAARALGGHADLAACEAALAGCEGVVAGDRSSAGLFQEAGTLQGRIGRLQADLAQAEERLAGLVREYGDHEHLLLQVSDCRRQIGETQATLAALQPLPEGFEDATAFRAAYDGYEQEVRAVQREAENARAESRELHVRLEERYSGNTAEDLARELADAEEGFRRAAEEGAVLLRIEAAARAAAAAEPVEEAWLVDGTAAWLVRLTGGRHRRLDADDGIPTAVRLAGGERLAYGLLSAGTQDAFALALRLALAERLLAGKGGFLVLDDPLVDLDPERREAACGVLAAFAADTQVLVLTCHPEHATLLQGKLIPLGGA